jgi:hypothetical protein
MLVGVRLEKNGVERGDDRRCQSAQQRQEVAAGQPAENSELVLDRNYVYIAGVQEVGSAAVRTQVLLLNLEANDVRIPIAPIDVIDRYREAPALGMPRCHSPKKVGSKCGNATPARQVIAEKRDGSNARFCFHQLAPPFSPLLAFLKSRLRIWR